MIDCGIISYLLCMNSIRVLLTFVCQFCSFFIVHNSYQRNNSLSVTLQVNLNKKRKKLRLGKGGSVVLELRQLLLN